MLDEKTLEWLEKLERLAKLSYLPWHTYKECQLDDHHEEIHDSRKFYVTNKNGVQDEYILAACNAVPELIQRNRKLEAEVDCLAERLACHNPNCDCGFDVKYWRNWAREKRERESK